MRKKQLYLLCERGLGVLGETYMLVEDANKESTEIVVVHRVAGTEILSLAATSMKHLPQQALPTPQKHGI